MSDVTLISDDGLRLFAQMETAERERDEALAREAALRKALTSAVHWTASRKLNSPDEELFERQKEWQAILAQPNPAAGKVLVDAVRLEALERAITHLDEAEYDLGPLRAAVVVVQHALAALRVGEEGARE